MKNVLIICLAFISTMSFSQKVDIDNHHFKVEYAVIGDNYITDANKTYSVEVSGDSRFDHATIQEEISLNGWERVESDGLVHAVVEIKSFNRGKSKLEKKVNKNRQGKVTSTDYWVTKSDYGSGTLTLFGPKNEYKKPEKKKKKKKKKKKEKEKKANPFLAGVNTDNAESAGESKVYSIGDSYSYSTAKARTSKAAYKEFEANEEIAYDNAFNKYHDNVARIASNGMNASYGHYQKIERVKFKRLDSDKHPEYEMFENAVQAMKAILMSKKFDQDISETRENMGPIIDYYISVKEKYNKDDKHPKRLKAAAMYNLAQIYYFLDQPDKTIEIGKEYIRWDHDKGDGEDFVEKGEQLKHLLEFHNADGRYFIRD